MIGLLAGALLVAGYGRRTMENDSTANPGSELLRRIQIKRDGDAVIMTPDGDLGEFVVSQIAEEAESAIRKLTEDPDWQHVVIDFCKTDYFGSSALGLFLRLWKRVREHGGRMALCNLSDHEIELLKVTRLNEFWIVEDTPEAALAAVRAA
jgi:stage II sporulation protein AA (anti-sigma F factor antagonist)